MKCAASNISRTDEHGCGELLGLISLADSCAQAVAEAEHEALSSVLLLRIEDTCMASQLSTVTNIINS